MVAPTSKYCEFCTVKCDNPYCDLVPRTRQYVEAMVESEGIPKGSRGFAYTAEDRIAIEFDNGQLMYVFKPFFDVYFKPVECAKILTFKSKPY